MNPIVGDDETAGAEPAPTTAVSEAAPAAAPPRLLIVDDETSILSAIKRVFRSQGYEVLTASSGKEGLALLEQEPVDLIISDMRMPEMDGAEFLGQVFIRWPGTKRILLTGYSDAEATIAAINRGKIWRYIAKPWNDDDLLVTVQQALAHSALMRENARLNELTRLQNEELKTLNAELEQKVADRTAELREANADLHQSFLATVQVFSNLIELREGRLAGHARRVADLARKLAESLGLDGAEQREVLLAGLLHDIGKVGMPDTMLGRAYSALAPADKIEFMRHPAKGQQLLMSVPQLNQVARIIRHHHECMDGSGYPDKIGGLMIPLGARILAVANDYDGLQSGALMLRQHSPKEALEFIVKNRGKRFDPKVVDALVAMMAERVPTQEADLTVTPPELKPGMTLTRDLMHRDGYLLLPKGRVVDAAAITQMLRLQDVETQPIIIHIRRSSATGVLRDRPEPAPPQHLYKEVALRPAHLKEGMMLSRNLRHHEGFLLLASGYYLDAPIIQQLRGIEEATGTPITVYVRMVER
jgi:putative nucleotidyltransferase with HDIG domain